jgi:hypothetical protein
MRPGGVGQLVGGVAGNLPFMLGPAAAAFTTAPKAASLSLGALLGGSAVAGLGAGAQEALNSDRESEAGADLDRVFGSTRPRRRANR